MASALPATTRLSRMRDWLARSSQVFLLVGAVVMIPLILAYNAMSYYIFRGKVEPGAHYH